MLKIDHRKTLKHLYHPSRAVPVLVDVPPMNFLMVDGRGKPNEGEFQQAASTLYPLAYTLKFMVRTVCGVDYHVMPLEVRWRVNREKKELERRSEDEAREPASSDAPAGDRNEMKSQPQQGK